MRYRGVGKRACSPGFREEFFSETGLPLNTILGNLLRSRGQGVLAPAPTSTATDRYVRRCLRRGRYYKPARSGGRLRRTPGSARGARRGSRTPLRTGDTPPRRLEG